MEMIFDWKIAIFALQLISTILTLGAFAVIKFNDFRHLSIRFDKFEKDSNDKHAENKTELKNVHRELVKIGKAIVRREAICEINHKK